MKYNLSKIMLRAWRLYRENKELSFGGCLHQAWLTAKTEEVNAMKCYNKVVTEVANKI